jgi:hypothetical protein
MMTSHDYDDDELNQREVYVTYRMMIELPEGATEGDILSHPEVTGPPGSEIIDWGFDCAISQRR